jgi:polyhydroxyalkanoate synthesis regulator phasin
MINISPKLDLKDNRIEGNGIKDEQFQFFYNDKTQTMTLQRKGKTAVSLTTRIETQRLQASINNLERRIDDLEKTLKLILTKLG